MTLFLHEDTQTLCLPSLRISENAYQALGRGFDSGSFGNFGLVSRQWVKIGTRVFPVDYAVAMLATSSAHLLVQKQACCKAFRNRVWHACYLPCARESTGENQPINQSINANLVCLNCQEAAMLVLAHRIPAYCSDLRMHNMVNQCLRQSRMQCRFGIRERSAATLSQLASLWATQMA